MSSEIEASSSTIRIFCFSAIRLSSSFFSQCFRRCRRHPPSGVSSPGLRVLQPMLPTLPQAPVHRCFFTGGSCAHRSQALARRFLCTGHSCAHRPLRPDRSQALARPYFLNITIVTPSWPSPNSPRRKESTYFSFFSCACTAFRSTPVPRPWTTRTCGRCAR